MGRIYDATWGRGFTALYDRLMASTEEEGLREMRREILSTASGRTIDLGAGTGANLGLYPDSVTELVLAEPDPHMLRKLQPKAEEAGVEAEVVEAGAERLPFEDSSFDTAVFTLVLCTVPDPAAALAEAARVLKPGGRLLFVEHVRSEEGGLARWQDRLETAVALLRGRLPLQPGHRGGDRGGAVHRGERRQDGAAEGPADRPAPGAGQRAPRGLTTSIETLGQGA